MDDFNKKTTHYTHSFIENFELFITKTTLLLSIAILASCTTPPSVNLIHKTQLKIEIEERAGVKYHKQGDYKKAFNKLSASAQWGMKQPQYLLGIMFLKGQYVKPSIEIGMGWLGVANEVDIKEWRDLYDSIYNKLTTQQKKSVNKKVDLYIKKYGMETHNLRCKKNSTIYSAKIRIYCQLRAGKTTPRYAIEGSP